MLTLLIGADWIENRREVLQSIARDVGDEKGNRILIVPELISHDTERRLCEAAGDTASRYAEVLSFSRLVSRVADSVGRPVQQCLDNGGRVVAMASAARQLHSRLKAYASVETRPEFLTGLVDSVDEFKRCCITADDLMAASKRAEGSLAQKLEELSLLLEGYDCQCQRGKRDPRDLMTWLLEELEEGTFAQEHVFYIDGFPDFTRQHMAILEHLMCNAENVTVSLNCDTVNSDALAFEKAGATASELIQCAKRYGIAVEIRNIPGRNDRMSYVRQRIFQGKIDRQLVDGTLQLYRTETVYQECLAAVQKVITFIQNGARYRDISIVCNDIASYRGTLQMLFDRCHIPVYISGTENILDKSVIITVLAALDTALGGFEQQDVLHYLKSILSPLDIAVCDEIENYAILWSINGSQWLSPWENHPNGLGEEWTDGARSKLQRLNQARELALGPLIQLRRDFRSSANLGQQVYAIYHFLERIQLSNRLDKLAKRLDADGDNRNAQILNQLWEILLTAMEQLHDVLGETTWDEEAFTRLLKLLLGQYDVGTIPTVLDSVMVGPVSAMRCQQTKHLLVLGALEGCLPGYGGSTGVLTDQERTELRGMGVPLTGGSMEGLQAEFAEIYGVFCGAESTVTVSCPGGQPSFLYRRLCQIAGSEAVADCDLGAALCDKLEAGAYLARWNAADIAEQLCLGEYYNQVKAFAEHAFGKVDPENIKKLYGTKLRLSASQVDKQADCRLSYFLRYGLRVKERKPATVDPAEFGTYVHAVLENTGRRIMEQGGFRRVSLHDALEIARICSEDYARERFSQIDSNRISYLFRRNGLELELIVQELWEEMQTSAFEPVGFEVSFGAEEGMSAIKIDGKDMQAELRGFVDRVDSWIDGDHNYFRVVDYKTGKKDFDYCDIYNGLGLQMLLYLFALEQEGCDLLGETPISAGVQYFPARVPLISADGNLTEEEVAAARKKLWKRKGLLLLDENVLSAMDSTEDTYRMPYSRKKDGTISGDLADRSQLDLLKAYVFALLGSMVDEIASGSVAPNPYTRGSSHNACSFCPFGSVCHKESVQGRRNYKMMSAGQFWEDVEREVNKHG